MAKGRISGRSGREAAPSTGRPRPERRRRPRAPERAGHGPRTRARHRLTSQWAQTWPQTAPRRSCRSVRSGARRSGRPPVSARCRESGHRGGSAGRARAGSRPGFDGRRKRSTVARIGATDHSPAWRGSASITARIGPARNSQSTPPSTRTAPGSGEDAGSKSSALTIEALSPVARMTRTPAVRRTGPPGPTPEDRPSRRRPNVTWPVPGDLDGIEAPEPGSGLRKGDATAAALATVAEPVDRSRSEAISRPDHEDRLWPPCTTAAQALPIPSGGFHARARVQRARRRPRAACRGRTARPSAPRRSSRDRGPRPGVRPGPLTPGRRSLPWG